MIEIIDFYATWCGPCKTLDKTLEEIKDTPGIKITKVNIEDGDIEDYDIRSVPTLIFIKDNVLRVTQVGAISKVKLLSIIDKLKEE